MLDFTVSFHRYGVTALQKNWEHYGGDGDGGVEWTPQYHTKRSTLSVRCLSRAIPEQYSVDYAEMMKDPEAFMLSTVSNPNQATTVMAVLELLSKHSTDEVYLGR